ncbi:hypothetical protein MRX96_018087 [Rhipicephalus microplus]
MQRPETCPGTAARATQLGRGEGGYRQRLLVVLAGSTGVQQQSGVDRTGLSWASLALVGALTLSRPPLASAALASVPGQSTAADLAFAASAAVPARCQRWQPRGRAVLPPRARCLPFGSDRFLVFSWWRSERRWWGFRRGVCARKGMASAVGLAEKETQSRTGRPDKGAPGGFQ